MSETNLGQAIEVIAVVFASLCLLATFIGVCTIVFRKIDRKWPPQDNWRGRP